MLKYWQAFVFFSLGVLVSFSTSWTDEQDSSYSNNRSKRTTKTLSDINNTSSTTLTTSPRKSSFIKATKSGLVKRINRKKSVINHK
jgi:hypothetical protein